MKRARFLRMLEILQKKYLDALRDVIVGFGIEFSLPQDKKLTEKGEPVRQPELTRILTQSQAAELFKKTELTVEVSKQTGEENFLPVYSREEETLPTSEIIRQCLQAAEQHKEQPKETLVFPAQKKTIITLRTTPSKNLEYTDVIKTLIAALKQGYKEFHYGAELSDNETAEHFKRCSIQELYTILGAAALRAHFADEKEYQILRNVACVENTENKGSHTRLEIPLMVRKRKGDNPYPIAYGMPIVELSGDPHIRGGEQGVIRERAIAKTGRDIQVLEDYLHGSDANPESVENNKYHQVVETAIEEYRKLPDYKERSAQLRKYMEKRFNTTIDQKTWEALGVMLIRKEDNPEITTKSKRAHTPFYSYLKQAVRRDRLLERTVDAGLYEVNEQGRIEPALGKEKEGSVMVIPLKDASGNRFIGMRKLAISKLQKEHPCAEGVYGPKGPSREVEFQAHVYGNLQTARQSKSKEIYIMPEFDALAFYLKNTGVEKGLTTCVLGVQNQYDCAEDILNIIAQLEKIHITLPPGGAEGLERVRENAERLLKKIKNRAAILNKEREKKAQEGGKDYTPLPEPVISIE